MRRTVILLAIGLWVSTGAAQAQEEGAGQQDSRPVFSLPPGAPPEERPDPTVQGPRAPGIAAPRAIDPNAPRSEQQAQTRSQPQQPAPAQTQQAQTRTAERAGAPAPARQASTGQADQSTRSPAPSGTPVAPSPQSGDFAGDLTGSEPVFDVGPERSAPSGAPSIPGTANAQAAASDTGFSPFWLIVLAGLFAGGLGYFLWQRRARPAAEVAGNALPEVLRAAQPETVPAPKPRPAPVAKPTPPVAPTQPSSAQLEVHFEPLEARWSEEGLSIKFRLYLRNLSDQPVHDIAVHLGIRSADQNIGVSRAPAGLPNLFLESLAARDMSAHEGEMRLDDSQITPVIVDGKEMVLPIVDLMPRYRDSADTMRKIEAALLVGRERNPPQPRLAPLPVHAALAPSDRLGVRMIALPGTAAAPAA